MNWIEINPERPVEAVLDTGEHVSGQAVAYEPDTRMVRVRVTPPAQRPSGSASDPTAGTSTAQAVDVPVDRVTAEDPEWPPKPG